MVYDLPGHEIPAGFYRFLVSDDKQTKVRAVK
jgi:hypothetical protein